MNLSPEKAAELHDLLGLLCSDNLAADSFERLVCLLNESHEARQFYVQYIDMDESLHHMAVTLDGQSLLADIQAKIAELRSLTIETTLPISSEHESPGYMTPVSSDLPAIPAPLPLSESPIDQLSSPHTGLRLPGLFSAGGLGWVLFATVSLAWVALWLTGASSGGSSGDVNVGQSTAMGGSSSEIEQWNGVGVWLDNGAAELSLPGVGYVAFDGPADFELLGPMRARLNRGRINMRVTEQSGHGFVIETPDGEVTDLGTEFGLDVEHGRNTNLIVREGAVDLRVGGELANRKLERVERLVGGEAVSFTATGGIQRIASIVTTGTMPVPRSSDINVGHLQPLISGVSDNIRTPGMKQYYEIVPQGLREDAVAYVDRVHQWNGNTKSGLPSYLVGADYVKPFNDDKMSKDVKVAVTLARPAKLYVFFDVRLVEPRWLLENFRKTGDMIGLDMGPQFNPRTKGTTSRRVQVGGGASIDHTFAIWERDVTGPGKVVLGANHGGTAHSGMYGIAAVELSLREGN